MDGAVLLCLLAEGEQKLHLVPGLQIRELAGPGQRVHVEEDVLTPALTGVGDEPVLREGGGGGGGREVREGGREGGRRVLAFISVHVHQNSMGYSFCGAAMTQEWLT